MESFKKSWWKVPVYCIIAGLISFHLTVRIVARFMIVKLPDGSVSVDHTRSMILSGILFFVVLAVGGLLFFRKMKRQEVFCSASVMVAFNIVGGLISYFTQRTAIGASFGILCAEISEWSSFISVLLYHLNLNQWISAAIVWALPYLFVLFGKRRQQHEDLSGRTI